MSIAPLVRVVGSPSEMPVVPLVVMFTPKERSPDPVVVKPPRGSVVPIFPEGVMVPPVFKARIPGELAVPSTVLVN